MKLATTWQEKCGGDLESNRVDLTMLEIPSHFYNEIISHSKEEAPNECCGILVGTNNEIEDLFRATNSEHSPYRYNVDPADLFRIHRTCEENNWDFIAIYHSHTHTEAYPSPTDIRLASWPDTFYIIASLEDPSRPVLRAFRIIDGKVTEEEVGVI